MSLHIILMTYILAESWHLFCSLTSCHFEAMIPYCCEVETRLKKTCFCNLFPKVNLVYNKLLIRSYHVSGKMCLWKCLIIKYLLLHQVSFYTDPLSNKSSIIILLQLNLQNLPKNNLVRFSLKKEIRNCYFIHLN